MQKAQETMNCEKITVPSDGRKITMGQDGRLKVPDRPIVPFIEGDGTGPDITRASMIVWNAAVEKAYGGKRKVEWMEIYAGEKANMVYGKPVWLPPETLDGVPRIPGFDQGPADDAGRRRHPQPERGPAAGTRPLRLPAAGAMVRRRALAGQAARTDGHGDLPRKFRGHLCGHRVGRGHAGGEEGRRVPAEGNGREEDPVPRHVGHRHQARLAGRDRAGSCGRRSTMRSTTAAHR